MAFVPYPPGRAGGWPTGEGSRCRARRPQRQRRHCRRLGERCGGRAGTRPAMSGPVAHGTPWYQRARYLTAPLRSPFVPIRAVTGRTQDGSRMFDPRGRRRSASETAACRHARGPAARGFAGQVLHLERTGPAPSRGGEARPGAGADPAGSGRAELSKRILCGCPGSSTCGCGPTRSPAAGSVAAAP